MKAEAVSPLVLVMLPSGGCLALSQDALQEARALGQCLTAGPAQTDATAPQDEPLLTAEQISERMNAPASWFLEQARKNAIPHVKLGKYVRFQFSAVRTAYEQRPK